MSTKIRNIIFIFICICVFSTVFIYLGTKKMNILPESYINGTYSYLEGAKLQSRPTFSLENFTKGTFQTQTEKWIGTKVPKRDSVMLFNAKVQRSVINVANTAFNFDSIPTYFGSKYAYTKSLDLISRQSNQKSETYAEKYQQVAQAINEFVEDNPNLNVTFAIPSRLEFSENNPTFNLTSNPIDKEFRTENLIEKLNSSVNYVDIFTDSLDEQMEEFFRTDPHWSIKGAKSAFDKLVTDGSLGLDSVAVGEYVQFEKPDFYGSSSRASLMLSKDSDHITDYVLDFTGFKIYINNESVELNEIDGCVSYQNGNYDKKNLFKDRYTEYFQKAKGRPSKLEFVSENKNGKQLLVIGDSYTSAIQRFFAYSYEKVVRLDHEESLKANVSLKGTISENNFTNVLILLNDNAFLGHDEFLELLKS